MEPFFYESLVKVLVHPFNWTFQQRTSVDVLRTLPRGLWPNGFVFHMSRCGSHPRRCGRQRLLDAARAASGALPRRVGTRRARRRGGRIGDRDRPSRSAGRPVQPPAGAFSASTRTTMNRRGSRPSAAATPSGRTGSTRTIAAPSDPPPALGERRSTRRSVLFSRHSTELARDSAPGGRLPSRPVRLFGDLGRVYGARIKRTTITVRLLPTA